MADHYDDSWRVIIDGIRRKRGIFNRSKLFNFLKFEIAEIIISYSVSISIHREIMDKTCG